MENIKSITFKLRRFNISYFLIKLPDSLHPKLNCITGYKRQNCDRLSADIKPWHLLSHDIWAQLLASISIDPDVLGLWAEEEGKDGQTNWERRH